MPKERFEPTPDLGEPGHDLGGCDSPRLARLKPGVGSHLYTYRFKGTWAHGMKGGQRTQTDFFIRAAFSGAFLFRPPHWPLQVLVEVTRLRLHLVLIQVVQKYTPPFDQAKKPDLQ